MHTPWDDIRAIFLIAFFGLLAMRVAGIMIPWWIVVAPLAAPFLLWAVMVLIVGTCIWHGGR